MSEFLGSPGEPKVELRRSRRIEFILTILIVGCGLLAWGGVTILYPANLPPEQPIPFAHRVHATQKQISCVFCHTYALDGPVAGMPAVQKCMLCHSEVIIFHPQIVNLRGYYERSEPVEWVRISELPDFVFFDHSLHLKQGIDCSHCHGDIAKTDRVARVHKFMMGFCIECHRENDATTDCFTCHR